MGTWAGYSHNFSKSSLRWLWSKIKYLIAVGADGCWNIWLTLGWMEHIHPTWLRVEKSNYSLVPSPKNQIQTVKIQLRKEICLFTFFSFLTDITFATQFGWSHTETNIRSQSDKCKWTPQIIIITNVKKIVPRTDGNTRQEWLTNRAIPPLRVASMICSLSILKK